MKKCCTFNKIPAKPLEGSPTFDGGNYLFAYSKLTNTFGSQYLW